MSESEEKENISQVPASPEFYSSLGVKPKAVPAEAVTPAEINVNADEVAVSAAQYNKGNTRLVNRFFKFGLPYVAVFAIGVFLYYFYFTDISLEGLFKREVQVASVTKQKKLEELYKQEQVNYQSWIRQYYFQITDAEVLNPDADLSGNGLTSFHKYILGLNPKVYDTLGLGSADSETLKAGTNPLSGLPLSDKQKQYIDQFIDLDVAVNKKKGPPAQLPFVQYETLALRGTSSNIQPNSLPFIPEITVYEPRVLTPAPKVQYTQKANAPAPRILTTQNPVIVRSTIPATIASTGNSVTTSGNTVAAASTNNNTDTTANNTIVAVNYPPSQNNSYQAQNTVATAQYNKLNIPAVENYLNIDTNIQGKLVIPGLGVTAPIIWSTEQAKFDSDLENGVIHLPNTAIPGSLGRAYISGHSSGYAFAAGDFKRVFANLAELPDYSPFIIHATDKNGKIINLHYVVYKRGKFAPNDPAQFVNTAESEVALGTCWPIGGTAERMVLIGRLDKID